MQAQSPSQPPSSPQELPRIARPHPERPVWLVCTCSSVERMLHSVRNRLDALGIEYYMATHKVGVQRNGSIVEGEDSYLGSYFFVRIPLKRAMSLVHSEGVGLNYVRIRPLDGRQSSLMTISDKALDDFRLLIDKRGDKLVFSTDTYAVGDKVIVVRGPLVGIVGTLVRIDDSDHLMLSIPGVLAVSVKVGRGSLRKLKA